VIVVVDDHGVDRVLSSDRPQWVPVVTGLAERQFVKLVGIVRGRGGEQTGVDRQCAGAHVMADGGYQGNPEVITPYRTPSDGSDLPAWKAELTTVPKRIRARVEHALAHLKSSNIPRNRRRTRDGVWHATRAVALMPNPAMTGRPTPRPTHRQRRPQTTPSINTGQPLGIPFCDVGILRVASRSYSRHASSPCGHLGTEENPCTGRARESSSLALG
jgi:hypothetical protein